MPVTPEGYRLVRLAEVLEDLRADLIQITDQTTGETLQVDFQADDPFIQAINTLADNNAATREIIQQAYNSFDPQAATGPALSALVQLNGLLRQRGTRSTAPITVQGNDGTTIPAGSRITNANASDNWWTTADITIGATGTETGTVESVNVGPISAPSGTLTSIVDSVAGWVGVTNTSDAMLGTSDETDVALRRRQRVSTLTPAVAPVEAIFGNLSNLDGVTFARVYVNNTLATDSRGIPAKAVAAVVVGGDDEEIARALFTRVGAGVLTFGNTSETLTDIQGFNYGISWIRPTAVDIYVNVTVDVVDASTWPSDGATRISEAIVTYAQGGAEALGIPDDGYGVGFVPGADVIRTRLFTPINSVPGHRITTVEIGTSEGGESETDITIDFDDVAAFATARIDVTVTGT